MALPEFWDWTEKRGRCNSSALMKWLEAEICRLIKDDAHMLLAGGALNTAGLICAHLAHKWGFVPTKTLAELRRKEE